MNLGYWANRLKDVCAKFEKSNILKPGQLIVKNTVNSILILDDDGFEWLNVELNQANYYSIFGRLNIRYGEIPVDDNDSTEGIAVHNILTTRIVYDDMETSSDDDKNANWKESFNDFITYHMNHKIYNVLFNNVLEYGNKHHTGKDFSYSLINVQATPQAFTNIEQNFSEYVRIRVASTTDYYNIMENAKSQPTQEVLRKYILLRAWARYQLSSGNYSSIQEFFKIIDDVNAEHDELVERVLSKAEEENNEPSYSDLMKDKPDTQDDNPLTSEDNPVDDMDEDDDELDI